MAVEYHILRAIFSMRTSYRFWFSYQNLDVTAIDSWSPKLYNKNNKYFLKIQIKFFSKFW